MLLLHLDQERTVKLTRTADGRMVGLSLDTCEFILGFAFNCMIDAVARVVNEGKPKLIVIK